MTEDDNDRSVARRTAGTVAQLEFGVFVSAGSALGDVPGPGAAPAGKTRLTTPPSASSRSTASRAAESGTGRVS